MVDFNNSPLLLGQHNRGFFFWVTLCTFIIGTRYAHCQNTGIVFGPDVVAEEMAVDFRIAYDANEDRWAYRNHLQYGFSDSFSLRGITLHTIDSSSKWNFRFFRIEGLWQFLESEEAGWDSALRFELEIAEGDDLPSKVRIAWTGMHEIDDYWQVRGNILTGYEIGPASDPGAFFEIRAQVSRKLNRTSRLAVDYFGNMNNLEMLGNWESQQHQLGPTLSIRLNETTMITAGALFGLSRAASDAECRITIGYIL
jgi:hypothetical protein